MYTMQLIMSSSPKASGAPYICINLGLRPIVICDGAFGPDIYTYIYRGL